MNILYSSTRGGEKGVTASRAILAGIASDGGLFVPEQFPKLDRSLREIAGMSYQETAFEVMKLFLSDYTEEELKACIAGAYDEKFDTPEIAPLTFADGAYYLELFHGNTIAFKDMALSILPYLMTTAAKKNHADNTIVILTATSGDTGKAALAGFADVPGTRIIVFYPKGGVSRVQELQMITQKGENTAVVGIKGNFDDAQNGVKAMFGDEEFKKELAAAGFQFSSANSINIGRLIPQVVYYVYAYAKLLANDQISDGEAINITVPTGNFGNILAAYFAREIGVPVAKILCASNDNRVLTDFFETGVYNRKREFILTTSPSMDILISSNLERLIYLSCGRDPEKTAELMADLKSKGEYTVTEDMRKFMSVIIPGSANQEECAAEIRRVYEDTGYIMDTHTGVASAVYHAYCEKTKDPAKTVIASTASSYKFAKAVVGAVKGEAFIEGKDDFTLIDEMEKLSGVPVPQAIEEIRKAEIRHSRVCGKEEMKAAVAEILGI